MLSAARLYPAQHRRRKTETERSMYSYIKSISENGILCKYLWYDSISTRWKQQQQIEKKKTWEKKLDEKKTWGKLFCSRNSSEILWQSLMSEFHGYKLFDATSSSSSSSVHQRRKKIHETKQIFIEENRMRIHMVFIRLITFHFRRFSAIIRHISFEKLITSGINEAIIIQ